ncbi:MAG: hypothetical protein R3286_16075, partial [Gammaproteobacteria bacterium]|nr:hypothetical protein [Gammaproteobacteria bacterium]
GWRLGATASGLAPRRLHELLAQHWPLPPVAVAEGGSVDAALALDGDTGGRRVEIEVEARGVGFSDSAGLHAAENLGGRLRAGLVRSGAGWDGRVELTLDAGGTYLDPVFLDLGSAPLSVQAAGRRAGDALEVSAFELTHAGIARLHGSLGATSRDGSAVLAALEAELVPAAAAPLYRTYLQPFLFGGALGALDVSGAASARLRWRRSSGAELEVGLDGLDVVDQAGRFAWRGLDGRIAWHESGASAPVSLDWTAASLYRLELGAGRIVGATAGRDFYLEQPVTIPTLDGVVEIHALDVRGLGADALTWEFRGGVRELAMARLTAALGWPTFGGTVSGRTPRVRFADGVVNVDGELAVRVFDGEVSIRDLSVRDPLGLAPVLRADVDVEDVSLHALTGAFAFGNIRGRLSGHVHGLVLQDWRPSAFDASFATPEDDDSPHRISQRAVRNLTRLGGAGAVLSSTVLGLFEEFSYRRLGLACRLSGGVCEMRGVAEAEGGGYVIVEGGGLPPRIDVIGHHRRVDWDVLIARLKSAVDAPAPVVR